MHRSLHRTPSVIAAPGLSATAPLSATLTATLTAALALFASAALAQTGDEPATRIANGQTFGAWTVTCEAIAVNETACILNQNLLRSSDNAFLAQMLAFWSADGSQRYLAARVPLGVYLPTGFAMRIDDSEEVIPFVWQACSQTLCEALIEIDDTMLADLTAPDTTIVASYRPNLVTEPVVFRFGMGGADTGLAALKPATADTPPDN